MSVFHSLMEILSGALTDASVPVMVFILFEDNKTQYSVLTGVLSGNK